VVEASLRSGSLITARLAGEQGRDVFAVPGAAHDPRGRGTNQLLRDGAILTETVDDVLNAWSSVLPASLSPTLKADIPPQIDDSVPDDARKSIVAALGTTPSHMDDILRHTGVPSQTAQMVFTELELGGRLDRHPGGRISLRATV